MSQFALYANQNSDSKAAYPYFVDVQNELLNDLNTRLVIPLTLASNLSCRSITHLCPEVKYNNKSYVLLTQQMTNVPTSALKEPLTTLEPMRNEILAAIDFLITGI